MPQTYKKDKIKDTKEITNHERHRQKNSWIRGRASKSDHVILEGIVLF